MYVPRVQSSKGLFKHNPKETLESYFCPEFKVSGKCSNTIFAAQVLLPGLGTGKSLGTEARGWHSGTVSFDWQEACPERPSKTHKSKLVLCILSAPEKRQCEGPRLLTWQKPAGLQHSASRWSLDITVGTAGWRGGMRLCGEGSGWASLTQESVLAWCGKGDHTPCASWWDALGTRWHHSYSIRAKNVQPESYLS